MHDVEWQSREPELTLNQTRMVQRYARNPEPDVWQARERELKLSYALLRDRVADLALMLSSGVALRLEVPLVSAAVCVHLCA